MGQRKAPYLIYKLLATRLKNIESIKKITIKTGIEAYRIRKQNEDIIVVWNLNGNTEDLPLTCGNKQASDNLEQISYSYNNSTVEITEDKLDLSKNYSLKISENPVFIFKK